MRHESSDSFTQTRRDYVRRVVRRERAYRLYESLGTHPDEHARDLCF